MCLVWPSFEQQVMLFMTLTARATCTMATLTPEVLGQIEQEKPLILDGPSSDDRKGEAIYTFSGTDADVAEIQGVINNLKTIAGKKFKTLRKKIIPKIVINLTAY